MGANVEIIGYAERAVAIPENVPTPKERDYSSRRWGNEAYISGQLFSVRLSAQGVEEGRDFVAAGLPIRADGNGIDCRSQRDLRHGRLQAALAQPIVSRPLP